MQYSQIKTTTLWTRFRPSFALLCSVLGYTVLSAPPRRRLVDRMPDQVTFSDFCKLIDDCSRIPSRQAGQASRGLNEPILRYLENWIAKHEDARVQEPRLGIIFFRLLFPQYDVRRS